eukprot:2928396-Pleurochrysis_carterae.AAC.1
MRADLLAGTPEMSLVYIAKSFGTLNTQRSAEVSVTARARWTRDFQMSRVRRSTRRNHCKKAGQTVHKFGKNLNFYRLMRESACDSTEQAPADSDNARNSSLSKLQPVETLQLQPSVTGVDKPAIRLYTMGGTSRIACFLSNEHFSSAASEGIDLRHASLYIYLPRASHD